MKNTAELINTKLEDITKEDFEVLKHLPPKDKEAIIDVASHIKLANRLQQGFWLGNRKHKTIYFNSAFSKISGYSLNEGIGKASQEFFDEESKKAMVKHHKLRNKGYASQYEADIVRKDKKRVTVFVSGVPTRDGGTMGLYTNPELLDKLSREDQKLLETIGYKGLNTVKKILPKRDREIIIKYRHAIKLANTMGHGFWIGNKNHKTIFANDIYQKTTEYSLKECIGKPSDFCFDEKSKKAISRHHKLRKVGFSSKYEATYLTKNNKKIPVLVIGAPTENGGTYGIHINLSEVKKLHEQKKISDQIIRNSTEAIVILEKNHKIKLWNTGAEKIFGYKEREVAGKKLGALVVPKELNEENKKIIKEVEKRKFIRNFETKRTNKNGEKIDVSLSITKVTNLKGQPKGYLVIYQDITQRKRVNTELQKRFEAIQDAYKELGIQKRQMDYMNEIIDIATSKEGIEKVGKLIVSAVCMLTKCDGAVLRLLGNKKKTLRLLSCLGVSHKWLDKNKITIENSLAEDAFKTKRPIIIQDIDSSTKHQGIKLVKAHKFKALILIPLMIEEKPLGTLSLYTTDPGKFRLIENEFLENFGKQCSLALYIKRK